MSVCLYNNRQIGRRIKDGMHTNLLSCINLELWFGGRAPAELRAWRLGRCLLDAPRVRRARCECSLRVTLRVTLRASSTPKSDHSYHIRVSQLSELSCDCSPKGEQSQLSHAYGLEYLRIPSLGPVVRRKTDHLAWARMGTDGCRGCMVITYEA